MLYKHWKKIVLALAGFFWASCDDTSSDPVSASNDTPSSSVTEGTSSSSNATSGNEASSSGEATSAASSGAAESSTSIDVPRSSSLDGAIDLYGCPSDICGPNISDSLVALYGVIEAKYGVSTIEIDTISRPVITAKYGVVWNKTVCETSQAANGNTAFKCDDGVTCEEKTEETMQSTPCEGDVCAKYGIVMVSNKTYTCDNGQVYNEAEFRMLYDAPMDKDED